MSRSLALAAPIGYAEDHVLRSLADRDEETRVAATVDLTVADPDDPEGPAGPAHIEGCRCGRCVALLLAETWSPPPEAPRG